MNNNKANTRKRDWVIVLTVSLFFFGLTSHRIINGVQTYRWLSTEARVKKVWVTEILNRRYSPKFSTNIEYEYIHNGSINRSSDVSLDPSFQDFSTIAKAKDYLSQFPVGSTIKIYVNPKNPAKSVIIPGGGFQDWGILAICFFIVIICLLKISRMKHVKVEQQNRIASLSNFVPAILLVLAIFLLTLSRPLSFVFFGVSIGYWILRAFQNGAVNGFLWGPVSRHDSPIIFFTVVGIWGMLCVFIFYSAYSVFLVSGWLTNQ